MHPNDLLILAGKNIFRAGIRTKLCVLAICVGITSVSSVFSFGLLAGESVQRELDRIGVRGVAFYSNAGEPLSDQAVETIATANGVHAAMPLAIVSGTIQMRNLSSGAGILGIDQALCDVFQIEVYHGSLPTAEQVRKAAKIVVIDSDFAQKVYKRTNVVGKTLYVTVNGCKEAMEICAVIQSQSAGISMMVGGKMPYLVYLPYTTLQNLDPTVQTDKLITNMDTPDTADKLLAKLNRTAEGSYLYENLNQYLDSFSAITETIAFLISGIAGISVVVGGIGVMNAMVSSIDTRTREIGIYRALGAKKREIVQTFLCEAFLLCLIGGLLGIACSCGIVSLFQMLFDTALNSQRKSILISLTISAACGLLFGILPALRAAQLDPIKAIRTE